MKRFIVILMALFLLCVCALGEVLVDGGVAITDDLLVEYGEAYYSTDEVALYLHAFRELPVNYITKEEARSMGWNSKAGNLWDVAYGACIGGDRFGNYEGQLPDAKGRRWTECDVNYEGGFRSTDRVLFSTDGLIYFTGDHYNTFELLYSQWYEEAA